MNIIGVLDRQTSGNYYLDGQDVNGMTDEVRSMVRNQQIGFVFQNFNASSESECIKKCDDSVIVWRGEKQKSERAGNGNACDGWNGRPCRTQTE